MKKVKQTGYGAGCVIPLNNEIHVNVHLTDQSPPVTVRIHLSFPPQEDGVHKISTGGHAHIILGMYWFERCLESEDWYALQQVFFPMWLALEEAFRNQCLHPFWKQLRRGDLLAWCCVMDHYFASLDNVAFLADPPIADLPEDGDLLTTTFSRVMRWFEHRLDLLERGGASPDELKEICEIWQGGTDSPAFKHFLSPYYWNTPTCILLVPNRLETLRARSARICDRMARLVESARPELAKEIRAALEAEMLPPSQ